LHDSLLHIDGYNTAISRRICRRANLAVDVALPLTVKDALWSQGRRECFRQKMASPDGFRTRSR